MRSPYRVNRYGEDDGAHVRGMRGAFARARDAAGYLLAMGALFLGAIYVLWKASAR